MFGESGSKTRGCLYIVATPIGNLHDVSYRAIDVLAEADLVLAEDTRHSRRLLEHYGLTPRLLSLHEHNERQRITTVANKCKPAFKLRNTEFNVAASISILFRPIA